MKSPESAKIEAADAIVDPRELLGGSFVYRNPKFTHTDPQLKKYEGKALTKAESENFEKEREESIRAGSLVGSCDLREWRSDQYCKNCKPTGQSKPCLCHKAMMEDIQKYVMNSNSEQHYVESRVQEVGEAVERSVQADRNKKVEELESKIKNSETSVEDKTKIKEQLDNLALQQKPSEVERAFYVKKVLLNGVMNTKTPACILAGGRYGIGAKKKKTPEPEWINPEEKYCHQFDLKPDEPFDKTMSVQDQFLLSLTTKTLAGLEKAEKEGRLQLGEFKDLVSPTISIGGKEICSSQNLCKILPPSSKKDLYHRIFADESKNPKSRDLFDGQIENTIARTLLRCFGPREWGGMFIRMINHLQEGAEACGSKAALLVSMRLKKSTLIQNACQSSFNDLDETSIKSSDEEKENARKLYSGTIFPFERHKIDNASDFCSAINNRYLSLVDVFKAAVQLNPKEICSDKQIKAYETKTTGSHN